MKDACFLVPPEPRMGRENKDTDLHSLSLSLGRHPEWVMITALLFKE